MDTVPTIPDLHKIALAIGWPKADVHQRLHDWAAALWDVSSLKELSDEQRIVFASQIRIGGNQAVPTIGKQQSRRPRPSRPTEPGVYKMASGKQKWLMKQIASEMRWSTSLLNDFLRTHFKVENVDALGSSADACKAIQLLKAYKGKREAKRAGAACRRDL